MNKKKIFAIVAFIILGLFMYAFANPLNDNSDDKNGNQTPSSDTSGQKDATNTEPLVAVNEPVRNNTRRNDTRRTDNTVNNQVVPPVQTEADTQNNVSNNTVEPTNGTGENVEPINPPTPVNPENPKPAMEENIPVVDLTMDKLIAVQELKDHRKDFVFEDDSEYKKVVEEYIKKINDSLTKNDITSNLEEGKKAIDSLIEEDLDAYRKAAKKEIADYADELQLTTDVSELLEGFYDEIDEANTKSAIDKIVEKAKKALDEIKAVEILTAYKEEAKKEIADYAKELELTTDVSNLLDEINKDIDGSEDKDAVDKVVEEAKKKLDDIKASEIAKAKEDATKAIDDLYTEDEKNLPEITDIKDKAKKEVENTDDIENLQDIIDKAEKDIKDIIDNKEYTVVFYGIYNSSKKTKVITTEKVEYKKAVTAPKMNKSINAWGGSIKLEFKGWDIDAEALKSITSDLEVHANYEVKSATTKISILHEDKDYSTNIKDFYHPYNEGKVNKYFELDVTDKNIVNAILNFNGEHIFVYENDDQKIRSVLIDKDTPDVYENNKYKKLQYYVLKLQGDRFHCDARIIYDSAAELADAIEEAKKAINDYKTVETGDISEVKDEKIKAIEAIEKMTSVEDVKNKVQPTKDAIDKIIANKTFDVTFVGKKSSKTVQVGYKKDATIPNELKEQKYHNVTYGNPTWNKELSTNIVKDVTINVEYEITHAYADVFLLADSIEIPKDRTIYNAGSYSYLKTVELVLTDDIRKAIANDKYDVMLTEDRDIRALLKDEKSLPKKDGKYKEYEFYVMKFCIATNAGFHIDGKLHYDKEAEALDNAKDELNKLIKEAEEKSTEGKTTASINELKKDIKTAKDVVKGNDINAINNSINELKKEKLENIEVTSVTVVNKKATYVEGQAFILEVKYSDNNGHKDVTITSGYTINGDTKTVKDGQTATVTYGKKTSNEFTYNVIERKIATIKVIEHKSKYYLNESTNIRVEATYNDNSTRELDSVEYRKDNFTTSSATSKRTATIVLIENNNIKDRFDYSVSKYSSREEELEAEHKKMITDLNIEVKNPSVLYFVMRFKNFNNKLDVSEVHRKGNYIDHEVTLHDTNEDGVYSISAIDFGYLRLTNSDTFDQYVYITYKVDGKTYVAKYREEDHGNIKFVSFI